MSEIEGSDVVIVGAGPAGSSAALALLARGASVTLIERSAAHVDRLGESLSGAGCEALRELGAWNAFLELEQRPSHYHRAAWGGSLEERHAIASRFGPDRHLSRAAFDEMLVKLAAARGARVMRRARAGHVEPHPRGLKLHVALPEREVTVAAPLAIDATGRACSLSRRLGATRHNADRLIGIARMFERGDTEPSTLVESSEHGWWYSAPLPRGRLVALLVTDADFFSTSGAPSFWERELAGAPLSRERLNMLQSVEHPRSYAATPGVLNWPSGSRFLPVGDAALSFDPIAAEGLCFALRSGIEAADALLHRRQSPSAYRAGVLAVYRQHLQRRELLYERERRLRSSAFWLRRRDAPLRVDGRAPGTFLFGEV